MALTTPSGTYTTLGFPGDFGSPTRHDALATSFTATSQKSSSDRFPSEKQPVSVSQEAIAYARLLLPKKHGYPLWQPEPSATLPVEYSSTGVTVGDLGFISSDGAFTYLFNTCLPSGHPINIGRVPPGFQPFELDPKNSTESRELFQPGSVITSSSVSWEGALDRTRPSSSSTIRFSCSPSEGAVLVLPEGATRIDLTRLDEFRAYAARNVQNWYRWVNGPPGRMTRGESLYLVTGADKASSWSVAVYRDANERSSLTLSWVDGAGEYPYVWEGSAAASEGGGMRTGPKRGQGPAESRRNQCVFVRGFRLEVNEAYLASAVASPSLSGIRMDEASGTGALHEREASTPPSSLGAISNRKEEKQGSVNEPYHPSIVVNRYLLNSHPDAQFAITHDDDWCSVLGEDDRRVPVGPELLNRILAQRYPVRDGGVIYLASTHHKEEPDMVLANVVSPVAPHYSVARTPRTADLYPPHSIESRTSRYPYSDVSTSKRPEPISRSISMESAGRPKERSAEINRESDVQSQTKETNTPIDEETFDQIVELDEDDDTYDFSWGMASAYFSQVKSTFEEMNQALAQHDLPKLSNLGHFLKGSSAALGVTRVQASCEKIQHYGLLRDEELGIDLTPQEATEKIKRLLVQAQADYKVAEEWLRNWFSSHRKEEVG